MTLLILIYLISLVLSNLNLKRPFFCFRMLTLPDNNVHIKFHRISGQEQTDFHILQTVKLSLALRCCRLQDMELLCIIGQKRLKLSTTVPTVTKNCYKRGIICTVCSK